MRKCMRPLCFAITLLCSVTACAHPPLVTAAAHPGPSQDDIVLAVVDSLANQLDPSATICLSIVTDGSVQSAPSSELLKRFRLEQRVVTTEQCPRTYAIKTARDDTLGTSRATTRPAGYIDPYYLQVGKPDFRSPTQSSFAVKRLNGRGGSDLACTAVIVDEKLRIQCLVRRTWLT